MPGSKKTNLRLKINGKLRRVAAPEHRTLLEALREDLGLTGTKHGCETGECGACTVLVDGDPVYSCLILAHEAAGKDVRTIESLSPDDPIVRSFADAGAVQCGYCTPGMVLSAKALLDTDPAPSEQAAREALSGNLCRCTGYYKILKAVKLAAQRRNAEPGRECCASGCGGCDDGGHDSKIVRRAHVG